MLQSRLIVPKSCGCNLDIRTGGITLRLHHMAARRCYKLAFVCCRNGGEKVGTSVVWRIYASDSTSFFFCCCFEGAIKWVEP